MISKNRRTNVAKPRQIAMYLCKNMTSSPLDAIGQLLGGRDMKENEISRILTKQERLLMLNELIVPEVLQEGKMFLDEDLILVN